MLLKTVENALEYEFKDKNILIAALTHPNYAKPHHAESYQRLEFLGDAYADFVIARFLYRKYPYKNEGFLTRMRSKIVSQVAIAKAFRPYGLQKEMRIGEGIDPESLEDRDGLVCDLFEALVGALIMDGSEDAAEIFILKVLKEAIDAAEYGEAEIDYKSRLLEICAKDGKTAKFVLLKKLGEPHDPTFRMGVEIDGKLEASAEGKNKRQAEQRAAKEIVLRR